MNNRISFLAFIVVLSMVAKAQHPTPQLLLKPANWEFERFSLPPAFAPGIPYKGVEELRFSPGMFNKDTASYFTYAFVAQLDNVTAVVRNDIRDYLLKYFKGLCSITARDRKLIVDTSKITVAIEKKKGAAGAENIYDAVLNVFGVFADGALVKLNMEIKVLVNAATKKTYLIFIISPREKTDIIWKKLYEIQKEFKSPD